MCVLSEHSFIPNLNRSDWNPLHITSTRHEVTLTDMQAQDYDLLT